MTLAFVENHLKLTHLLLSKVQRFCGLGKFIPVCLLLFADFPADLLFAAFTLLESPGIVARFNNMTMMGQPIQ